MAPSRAITPGDNAGPATSHLTPSTGPHTQEVALDTQGAGPEVASLLQQAQGIQHHSLHRAVRRASGEKGSRGVATACFPGTGAHSQYQARKGSGKRPGGPGFGGSW